MFSRVEQNFLDNGARVVTETVPGSRSTSIGVLVAAGPADEPTGKEGLAHLVEHLLFQGTSNRSALEIARLMDGAGGQVGGFVTRDYTCFHATVLDDYRYHALDLLGDMLLNPTFPEGSLALQKDTILSELEGLADSPTHRVEARVKELAFADHPLGRPIAGSLETVRRLTREDAIYFAAHHYTPDRITLAASGPLESADFVAQCRDAFWRLLGTAAPREPSRPAFQGGVRVENAALSQAYFALGLPAPAMAAGERYALHIFDRLLGGGISSRLFRRVREEQGLAYSIGSEYQAYAEAGLLLISGWSAPENLEAVLRLTFEELSALATGERIIDEEELRRSSTALANQFQIATECSSTRMSRLATQMFYFGRPLGAEEILASIRGVDNAALERLAGEWLAPSLNRPALAVLAPAHRLDFTETDLEVWISSLTRPSLHGPVQPVQEAPPCH